MNSEEYVTLLSCLGDIQTAVDAIGLDVERLCEDVLEDDPRTSGACDRPQAALEAPSWVNGGGTQSVDTDSSARGRLGQLGPAVIALSVFAGYGILLVAAVVFIVWIA